MSGISDADRLDPALRKLIGTLLVGLVAVLLDTTIVNVAVDTLTRELSTSVSVVQWVNTSFLLALGMAIPLTGWSVGRFGAKRVWLLAVVLFLVGSVLAGSAWSIDSLIAFRVVQGLGGGLMLPVQQTLLVQAAGPRRLGRVMAAISLPAVIIPILGPVAGGLILSDASWRWIFFINVPFGLAALLMAWRWLPATSTRNKKPLDILGLALLTPALAAILFALSQVAEHGNMTEPTGVIPLLAGVLLLGVFVVHAVRGNGEPTIDVHLFRVRSFAASASVLFMTGLSLYGVALLLPLFYQQVHGQTALVAGVLVAPQGIGSLLARGSAGRLSDRFGPRPVVLVGVFLALIGALPYTWAGVGTSEVLLGACLIMRGAGLSAVNVAVMVAAYRGLCAEQVPHASSATRILLQVGGSFGVAVAAVILQQEVGSHAAADADAFGDAFRWLLGLTAVAAVPALFLPGRQAGTLDSKEMSSTSGQPAGR